MKSQYNGGTPKRYSVNVQLSKEENQMLDRVAEHHNMYAKDVLKALLRREHIRISK